MSTFDRALFDGIHVFYVILITNSNWVIYLTNAYGFHFIYFKEKKNPT